MKKTFTNTLLSLSLLLTSSITAKEVTIFLIRHGETDWNLAKKIQGSTDIPLNEEGKLQAKATADRLLLNVSEIKAIYSSDLSRAYETAKPTAEKLDLPIFVRPAFRELNAGCSEGMLISEKVARYKKAWEELGQKYPNKRDRWNFSVVPGEETINALLSRVKGELLAILQNTPDKNKIAVFCHGKVVQAFIADTRDINLEEVKIPNGTITEVAYDSDKVNHPFQITRQTF